MNINSLLSIAILLFFISCSTVPSTNTAVEITNTIVKPTPVPTSPLIPMDYLMGKFDPEKDDRFALVEKKYADREGLLLRQECYADFIRMWEAAKANDIHFVIRSATRNFDYQKGIWERKWNGTTKVDGADLSKTISVPKERAKKILEYSSMPGTSRHHWGTDLDLNSFENSYFESGQGLKEYEWLLKNAATFGFCQPYTPKGAERPTGYNEEKWHWSYLPLSTTFTQQAELHLKDGMIKGFEGANAAPELAVVKNYVLGINQACKK